MWDEPPLIPDLVVNDVAYVRTGLMNEQGHMILKRVSKPVGFTADFWRAPPGEYIVRDDIA